MNKIKELAKQRDTLCSQIRSLNTVKIPVPPSTIYKFNAMPTKIPTRYFIDVDNIILKLNEMAKKLEQLKQLWEKRSSERIHFKT